MGTVVIPASVNRSPFGLCCASKNTVKFQKESAMPYYLLFKPFILHESKQFYLLIITVEKKVFFSSPLSSPCSDLSELNRAPTHLNSRGQPGRVLLEKRAFIY